MKIKQLYLQDLSPCLNMPEDDGIHVWILPLTSVDNLHKNIHKCSHALLRQILSAYTQIPAERLIFSKGLHGKPALIEGNGSPQIEFSISHSGKYAAFAFSVSSPVGIDIENSHRNVKFEQVASRIFLPEESSALSLLSEEEKQIHFFRLWTRTESFLKGLGTGLSVSFCDKKIQEEYSSWEIRPIPAPDGYICSLAYRL